MQVFGSTYYKEHAGVRNFGRIYWQKRWEVYRQDKTKDPILVKSQQKRIKAFKAQADVRANRIGHEVVRLEVDWRNIYGNSSE